MPRVIRPRTTLDVASPWVGDVARDPVQPWRVLMWTGLQWLFVGVAPDDGPAGYIWPARDALPTTDPEDC